MLLSASFREKSLTAQQLVAVCVQCFCEENGGEKEEAAEMEFAHSFFLSHQWLVDSAQLITSFINYFQEKKEERIREAVCNAVVYWIQNFPQHFDAQPQVCAQVVLLKTIAEGVPEAIRESLDVSRLPSFAWLRSVSVRNHNTRQTQVSLSFEKVSPADVATSLSHIDYRHLSRISITELKQYVRDGNVRNCPMLERSICVFNNLTDWVQCMILNKTSPKDRAEVLVKFVIVAKHLRKMNNFNTLMAVIGGISHSTIARLAKTHAHLSTDVKKELAQLTCLVSAQHNFSEYRKALTSCHSFKIPIIGVHLKDLMAINCAGADFEKNKTIRKKTVVKLASLLTNFLVFNQKSHSLSDVNLDLINTLKVALDIRYNESDIYDLSLRREPKTFMNFEPTRGVVFAEWASGVSVPLDSITVMKHVSAMVDVVFKHYDDDGDGFISQTEFRQIAGNFPFIDAFVKIDVDHDGLISKTELTEYFLRANKDSVDIRRGFKHCFGEMTFLTPATCDHCSKMLWGLLRQGFKCKDCGITVHNACKANVVAECRRKSCSSLLKSSDWISSPRASMRRTFFSICKKSSQPRSSTSASAPGDNATSSSKAISPNSLHLRAQSDSVNYYKPKDPPTPDDDRLVSLACEEVFDDDLTDTATTASLISKP